MHCTNVMDALAISLVHMLCDTGKNKMQIHKHVQSNGIVAVSSITRLANGRWNIELDAAAAAAAVGAVIAVLSLS